MKSLLVLSAAAACAHAAFNPSSVPRQTSDKFLTGGFVVELAQQSGQLGKRGSPHAAFYAELAKRATEPWQVRKEFNDPLFVGTSIHLTNPKDINKVISAPGVIAVRPIVQIPAPKPVKKVIVKPGDAAVPPDSQASHKLIAVDKLHAQGILGKGVKIGILDTGTDYTHPSLGGGFGAGHKVFTGFDFVGDAYDGTNTPVPDNDPLDQCNGHGTHVAGIIGADPGNAFNISGIAYQSSIASYRIFGCSGSVSDDIIIEALLRGNSDGMDILTMSLGGADGWTESSSSVVSSRLSAQGKVVTIAAGNDGGFGSWYTSSPGNAINSISVASLDNIEFPVQNAVVSGVTHAPIPYNSLFPLPVNTSNSFPIFATSTDTTVVDDACNPLPASTPNLSGSVVIIRRGTCSFVQKLTNAAAFGANKFLIYNNAEGLQGIDTGNFTTAALITAEDGAFLVGEFAAKAPIQIAFPQTGGSAEFPDPAGGLISSFTSYGPSFDMFFKPAVAAPGGNILSTFPVPLGSFAVLSGTSMATPATAGSAALILSSRGINKQTALGVRDLLQTFAQPVASSHTDGDPLQTLAQQGAGLLNVFNAVHATTIVSPGQLLLNDTTHARDTQIFTVRNTGKTAKTFKLTHQAAGTMVSITPGDIFAADGPVPLDTTAATVSIIPSTLIVPAGASIPVAVHVSRPAANDATLPVFSGWVVLTSSSETLRVAYLGVAGTLKNKQVIDTTDEFFGLPTPVILDSIGDVQEGPVNYTFVGADFPTLLFRQAFGSPAIKIDLVSASTTFTPTITTRGFHGVFPGFFPHGKPGGSFAAVKTIGSLDEFDFVPRNSDDPTGVSNAFNTIAIDPVFANGTTIPNGQYKVLLRALRVSGDPSNEADYESFLSPIIGVEQ